jgi:hypothetical protein
MTCIAAVVSQGVVHMAGDSASICGQSISIRADKKVFESGPYVFGFTTSWRMGDLLRYSFKPPWPRSDEDLDAFMRTQFIDALRACLKAGGFAEKEKEAEQGGTFLVGISGRLFRVGFDYQVGEALAAYDSVGCGEDIALGSLYSTPDVAPFMRLAIALEAAERHSSGVRRPFCLVSGGSAQAGPGGGSNL